MTEQIQWNNERSGVFSGRVDGKVVGRVAGDFNDWDWASYRGGWTHDSGKAKSFADACAAVAKSRSSK